MNWSYAIYTVLIWGGWLGAVAFPIFYALTARFWKSPLGRHFWTYSTVIAMLYTSSMIKNYVPDFEYDTQTRYILLCMCLFVIWWRIYEYWRILHHERKRRKEQIRRLEALPDPEEFDKTH